METYKEIKCEYRGITIEGTIVNVGDCYTVNIISPIVRIDIDTLQHFKTEEELQDKAIKSIKSYIKTYGLE